MLDTKRIVKSSCDNALGRCLMSRDIIKSSSKAIRFISYRTYGAIPYIHIGKYIISTRSYFFDANCSGVHVFMVKACIFSLFNSSPKISFTFWCLFNRGTPTKASLTTISSNFAPLQFPSLLSFISMCSGLKESVNYVYKRDTCQLCCKNT